MFVNASPLPKQEREHYFNKNDSITEPTSSFHKGTFFIDKSHIIYVYLNL
jgi:hypothetical protein